MPSVTYQLTYNQTISSIREYLLEKIEEFSEDYPEFIDLENVLTIDYNIKLSEQSFLICFTINFKETDLVEQNINSEGKLAEEINSEEKIYNKRNGLEANLKVLIQSFKMSV